MRRTTRAAVLGVVLAGTLLLAGCQKPAPQLTVQTGSFSTTVSPTSYAFDATHVRTYAYSLPVVTAKTDGSVLIDVPREVVGNGWAVNAISVAAKPVSVGSSGPITDRHTYRVAAQTNNGNPFIVQIVQLHGTKADGSVWSFLVRIDDGT